MLIESVNVDSPLLFVLHFTVNKKGEGVSHVKKEYIFEIQ